MSTINKHVIESLDNDTLIKYISIIVSACSSDGLSATEMDAIKNWVVEQGRDESVLKKALSINFDAKNLDSVSKSVYGPSLVLDAFKLASVDGLSNIEKKSIYNLGQDLGLNKMQVDSLGNILNLSSVIGSLWTQVNS
jgi:hypothetical protein